MIRVIAILSALLFSVPSLARDWCDIKVPPVEYQYEPRQQYMIAEWPHEMLSAMCWGDGRLQWRPEGSHGGCMVYDPEDPNFAFIFVLAGLPPKQVECILVHEKAHLNGWMHGPSHPHYLDETGKYRPQRGPFRR